MTFEVFEAEAKMLIEEACGRLGYPKVEFGLEVPPSPELGDLSCNISFGLSKILSKPPFEIAQSIVGTLDPSEFSTVKSIQAHGSGYLNFHVDYGWLCENTLAQALSQEPGRPNLGHGRRVSIEHTSVNPNKALHLGHIRNTIIGDTLARILSYSGYDVVVLNYIDDTGVQVADLLVGFKFANFPLEPPPNLRFDQYCGDEVYVGVNRLYASNPRLAEARKQVLKELEEGRGESYELGKAIIDRVVRDNLSTCWRVGARYDLLNWESHIMRIGLWDKVFEELKRRKLVRLETEGKYKGTWCFVGKEGDSRPLVLVRSDGTKVYEAKDIAYAAWKLGGIPDPFGYSEYVQQPDGTTLWTTTLDGETLARWFANADITITLVDVRQRNAQRLVAQGVSALSSDNKKYVYLTYEVVALSRRTAEVLGMETEGKSIIHMAGRKGTYVNADPFLDILKAKGREEAARRNEGADERWLDFVGEQIATASLRYEIIKQDLDKMIVFDIDEAMKLEGDTGPYLQYTYARACSIIKKADDPMAITPVNPELLGHPSERLLILQMSKLRRVIEACAIQFDPQPLAKYTHALATIFNEYYEKVPILREGSQGIREARLTLVQAFRNMFQKALWLLGIPALERI